MATQVLLIRPSHKKHKTNPITPITPKKKKKFEGPNMICQAITQYIKPSHNKSKIEKAKSYKLYLKSQKPIMQNQNVAAKIKKKAIITTQWYQILESKIALQHKKKFKKKKQ